MSRTARHRGAIPPLHSPSQPHPAGMIHRSAALRSRSILASPLLLTAAVAGFATAGCGSLHRVPRTTATKIDEPPPVFTSRSGAPVSFVASTSDAKTTRVVMLRDGLTKPAAFRMASDYLGQKFTIYVSDPNAGYLMTPWQATLSRDGAPELRYRTRVILRFLGDDWRQLAVNAEANWLRGEEWEVGYDSALLDSVTAQLGTRLGRRN